ncbi:MAG: glycosyltransferase family 4 protein [Geobacteraceae bacterium]|nr:glycosyltransferase family 4 protein [Geobacteraceae bacterium]
MNIAFFRYSLFNRGGDRLSLAYANHLASIGHDVTLYVKELETVFDTSPFLKIKRVPCSGRIGCLYYAATHCLGHDVVIVDIIHLHCLLSRHNRVIYYAQADDIEYYDNFMVRALIDCLYRIHFYKRNPMISMSQHLSDIFVKRYRGIEISTLTTGIDHNLFYPDADPELVHLKGLKKAIVFMLRGDSYRKGIDVAMSLFSLIDADMAEKMELWVCGESLAEDMFRFTVRNFGVISDERLRQLLSSADIFLYPSRHEGFGLFPLEAMACGCVAVTTAAIPYAENTPSMLVSPIGSLTDLKENLQRVVFDSSFLERSRVKAFQDASLYDFEKSKFAFEAAVKAITHGFDA